MVIEIDGGWSETVVVVVVVASLAPVAILKVRHPHAESDTHMSSIQAGPHGDCCGYNDGGICVLDCCKSSNKL